MTWKNADKGPLPKDKQEVIIAVGSEKFVAVFDAPNNCFAVSELGGSVYTIGSHQIYWIEIQGTAKKPE